MTPAVEHAAAAVLTEICGARRPTPDWLQRPGEPECAERWPLVQAIYRDLTGLDLTGEMPPRERRQVDGVFEWDGKLFIFEMDEKQHFNRFRAQTLRLYPSDVELAFNAEEWLRLCDMKGRLEGGGFGKAKPPLFPGEHGRHWQRAFRDALADLLPSMHGYLPTLRLYEPAATEWVHSGDAGRRMRGLLEGWYGEQKAVDAVRRPPYADGKSARQTKPPASKPSGESLGPRTAMESNYAESMVGPIQGIIRRFKEQGYCQVPGYNRFGYVGEASGAVVVSRERGQDARIPFRKLEQAVQAVRSDPTVYDRGPSALREYGITHISSPIWSLLHLLRKRELLQ